MASRVSAQTPTFKVKVAELFKERHPDGILPEGKVSEEAATMGRLWQKKYNEPSPRIGTIRRYLGGIKKVQTHRG
jgi:hypothetical protein